MAGIEFGIDINTTGALSSLGQVHSGIHELAENILQTGTTVEILMNKLEQLKNQNAKVDVGVNLPEQELFKFNDEVRRFCGGIEVYFQGVQSNVDALSRSLSEAEATLSKIPITKENSDEIARAKEEITTLKGELNAVNSFIKDQRAQIDSLFASASSSVTQTDTSVVENAREETTAINEETTAINEKREALHELHEEEAVKVEAYTVDLDGVQVIGPTLEDAEEHADRIRATFEALPDILQRGRDVFEDYETATKALGENGKNVLDEAIQRLEKLQSPSEMVSQGMLSQGVKQDIDLVEKYIQKVEQAKQTQSDAQGQGQQLDQSLSKPVEKVVRMRTQMMLAREEMMRMIAAGQRGTPEFQQLALHAASLRKQMVLANAAMQYYATPNRHLAALKSGLQGVAGATGLVTGVMGLFNAKSEEMAKIQTRIQSVLGIVIGLETTYNMVKKTSFVRMALEEARLWLVTTARGAQATATTADTIATEANTMATGANTIALEANTGAEVKNAAAKSGSASASGASGAAASRSIPFFTKATNVMKGFGRAIAGSTTLLLLIPAAMIGIAVAINKYVRRNKELSETQKMVNEAMREGAKSAMEEKVHLDILYKAATDTNLSLEKRKEAVSELQKQYPAYFGNLTQEAILAGEASTAYKQLATDIVKAAQARAIEGKMAEIAARQYEEQRGYNADTNWLAGNADQANVRQNVTAYNGATTMWAMGAGNMAVSQSYGPTTEYSQRQQRQRQHLTNIQNFQVQLDTMAEQILKLNANIPAQATPQKVNKQNTNKPSGNNTYESTPEALRARINAEYDEALEDLIADWEKDARRMAEDVDDLFDVTHNVIDQARRTYEEAVREADRQADDAFEDIDDDLNEQAEKLYKRNMDLWITQGKGRNADMYAGQVENWNDEAVREKYRNLMMYVEGNAAKGLTDFGKALNARIRAVTDNTNGILERASYNYMEALKGIIAQEEDLWIQYLNNYGSYEEQRYAITATYERKAAEIREDATLTPLQKEYELLTAIAERDAQLSKLSADQALDSIDFNAVFGNYIGLAKDAISETLENINALINSPEFKKMRLEDRERIIGYRDNLEALLGESHGTLDFSKIQKLADETVNAYNYLQEARKEESQRIADLIEATEEYNRVMQNTQSTEAEINAARIRVESARRSKESATRSREEAETNYERTGKAYQQAADDTLGALNGLADGLNKFKSDSLPELFDGLQTVFGALQNLNIGGAIGEAIDCVAEGFSKAGFIGQLIAAILKVLDVLKDGIGKLIASLINTILSAVRGIIDNILSGKFLQEIISSIVKGLGNLLITLIKRITGILTLGTFKLDLASAFYGSNAKKVAEITERLTKSNEHLAKRVDNLSARIDSGGGLGKNLATYEAALAAQKELQENNIKILRAQMSYTHTHHSNAYYADDRRIEELYNQNRSRLAQVGYDLGAISSMANIYNLSPDQLKAIHDYAPDLWQYLTEVGKYDKSEYWDAVVEQAGKTEELTEKINQNLTQTSFDSMRDSFLDTLTDMNSDAKEFGENLEQTMFKALINSYVLDDEFEKKLKDWQERYAKAMKITDERQRNAELAALRNELVTLRDEKIAERDMYAEGLDISGFSSFSQEATKQEYSGSFTQDSMDEFNGRMTTNNTLLTQILAQSISQATNNAELLSVSVEQNRALQEIRGLQMNSNAYLEDIARYSRLSYNDFSQKLDVIANNLS